MVICSWLTEGTALFSTDLPHMWKQGSSMWNPTTGTQNNPLGNKKEIVELLFLFIFSSFFNIFCFVYALQ